MDELNINNIEATKLLETHKNVRKAINYYKNEHR